MDFDSIINQTEQNMGADSRIIAQETNGAKIKVDSGAIDAAIRGRSGAWDAAEYGISAEQAQAMIAAANTPEARAEVMRELAERALRRADLAESADGKIMAAFADRAAWHALGTTVRGAMSGREVLYYANMLGLLWEKWALSANGPNGESVPNGKYSVMRTDCNPPLVCADSVGEGYEIFNQFDCVEILDSLLELGLEFESAGALRGGKELFFQARLPDCDIAGDGHSRYLGLFNGLDGVTPISFLPTATRWECANTSRVDLLRQRGKRYALRHSKNVRSRVPEIKKALALVDSSFRAYAERAERMRQTIVEPARVFDIALDCILDKTIAERKATGAALRDGSLALAIAEIADADERHRAELAIARFEEARKPLLEKILTIHHSARGGNGSPDGWHVAQSVTEVIEHGGIIPRRDKTAEAKFYDEIEGKADDLKQTVFDLVLAQSAN
jgi:hypothetical protein